MSTIGSIGNGAHRENEEDDMSTVDNLRNRYTQLCENDPARDGAVNDIESALDIELPQNVWAISRFFGGDLLGGKSHYRFDVSGPPTNVTEETLRLRKAIGLPKQYVVLAEPPESLILLDTEGGGVFWLDSHDVYNLARAKPLTGSPTRWQDYLDFFSYLLDEEVEDRNWSNE